jgi:hypothetical protein
MSEVQWSATLDPKTFDVWGILNTVKFGHDGTFYWIEMPDGKRKHFITRGKLWASLAVLRMNYPDLKLQPVGTLPAPKRKSK